MAQIIDMKKENMIRFTEWMHKYIELPRGSYADGYVDGEAKKQIKESQALITGVLQAIFDNLFSAPEEMISDMQQCGVNLNDPIISRILKYTFGNIEEEIAHFNLKKIVKERGLTAYKIGQKILESTADVHEWIKGTSRPSFFQCDKLGRAIGVDSEIVLAHFGHGKYFKKHIIYRRVNI